MRLGPAQRAIVLSTWLAVASGFAGRNSLPVCIRSGLPQVDWRLHSLQRLGLSTEERRRLAELEKENRELRRANEILKSASIFFAAELDGRRPR